MAGCRPHPRRRSGAVQPGAGDIDRQGYGGRIASMTPSQRAFLEDEFFQLTLGAAMQRGGVYRSKLTERERRPVHTTLREVLESLLPQYEGGGIGDDVHLANINRLAQAVTTRHAGVLEGGRFRI